MISNNIISNMSKLQDIFLHRLLHLSRSFKNGAYCVTFALWIKAVHTITRVGSWAQPVAKYWLTYKTSKSADVHHNRTTLVCRKASCRSEGLRGLTRDTHLKEWAGGINMALPSNRVCLLIGCMIITTFFCEKWHIWFWSKHKGEGLLQMLTHSNRQ